MSKITGLFFCLVSALFLVFPSDSFAGGTAPDRRHLAEEIASQHQMDGRRIHTSIFELQSWTRLASPGKPLRIYIEGDGFAWSSSSTPSFDPTPRDPIVLQLAGLDRSENLAYLARPCQYVEINQASPCQVLDWTDGRFSETVIASMNEAVTQLKEAAHTEQVELVGYSGGAAVALLVAGRRSDIRSIRTIAGNLNPTAVNHYHHMEPLKGSLDPMEVLNKVNHIPQLHFIGDEDKVIPVEITQDFVHRLPEGSCAEFVVIPQATHHSGWKESWSRLLPRPFPCQEH